MTEPIFDYLAILFPVYGLFSFWLGSKVGRIKLSDEDDK